MLDIVDIVLLIVAAVLSVPLGVVTIQCFVALFARRSTRQDLLLGERPSIVVLIPAHNEASIIARTLVSVRSHLGENDRIVVIADNCSDETAVVARSYGVEVRERREPLHQGKGYAIEYGLRTMASNPPDVVIMLDADCVIERGDLEQLAQTAADTGRPVQSVYLMNPPMDATPRDILSAFAFCIRNLVRPLGLHALGLPCLLTGSGMAFPWRVLRTAGMRGESIVEDMQLAVDMIRAGHPPLFCPQVVVRSLLPSLSSNAAKQRTRWEHGHLRTMFAAVPKLLATAISRRKLSAAVLALDLSVPPLSLLAIGVLIVGLAAIAVGFVGGSWTPCVLLGTSSLLVMTTLTFAWLKFARHDISATTLLATPLYLLWKLPIYLRFVFQPHTSWNKTSREEASLSLTPATEGIAVAPSGEVDIDDLPTIPLREVRVHSVTEVQVIDTVMKALESNKGGWIITVNLQHLQRCENDPEYRELVEEADLVVADGMPLVWAGALQGTPVPQRIAGSDLISSLTSAAAEHGRSIFFLGGTADSAQVAASTLQARYPALQVAGTYSPDLGFENDPAQIDHISEMLVDAAPDVIYVALGSPKQEQLIRQLRDQLPSAWWIGVGISFSFVAGQVKRAPLWMQRCGLEWMHRLVQEPRRLAHRYLVQGLPFGARLLFSSLVRGWRPPVTVSQRAESTYSGREAPQRLRSPLTTARSDSSRSTARLGRKQFSGDRPANQQTR